MFNLFKLVNHKGREVSLQVSEIHDIPAGNFSLGGQCLVKNITEDNITLQIRLRDSKEFVTTVLYPGWNPELIVEIKNVSANTLQYGI